MEKNPEERVHKPSFVADEKLVYDMIDAGKEILHSISDNVDKEQLKKNSRQTKFYCG